MQDDGIIVEIRGGRRPPFWLLHPVGGNVLFGHLFARKLPVEHALLGVQARGLDGRAAPFDSIPDAARYYLELIRKRQPEGPYFLGGPSFGGNLAYEMARTLRAQGASVGMVALFDAFAPGYPRPVPLRERLRARLRRLGKGHTSAPQADEVFAAARIPDGHSRHLIDLRRVSLAHEHALRTYRAEAYEGRVHLFRAAEAPNWEGVIFDDETNGWGRLAQGGVEITTIPGTHQFILDPPWVHTLISEFGKALQRAVDAALRTTRASGTTHPPVSAE